MAELWKGASSKASEQSGAWRARSGGGARFLATVLGFAFAIVAARHASASDEEGVHKLTYDAASKKCEFVEQPGKVFLGTEVVLEFDGALTSVESVRVVWSNKLESSTKKLKDNQFQVRHPNLNFGGEVLGQIVVTPDEGEPFTCKPGFVVLFSAHGWSPLLDKDSAAYEWWIKFGEAELDKLDTQGRLQPRGRKVKLPKPEYHKVDHFLVHLPSGAVAPRYPSDITESARSQVFVIVPTDSVIVAKLDVKQCDTPQTFRAEFQERPASEEKVAQLMTDSGGKLDRRGAIEKTEFALQTVGPILRCGPPELEYSLTMALKLPDLAASSGTATKDERITVERLRVNPKRHIAAIVAVGWDFAKDLEYFKDTTTDLAVVDCRQTQQGVILYVGAQWMVAGVDYHNMRWWNYFVNPFVAVNAAAPLDDIAFGLAITPTGGISIAVGPTLHKRTHLGDGFSKGQVLADPDAAIPTSRRWEKPVVGAFIGLAIDSNVFRALTAASKSD